MGKKKVKEAGPISNKKTERTQVKPVDKKAPPPPPHEDLQLALCTSIQDLSDDLLISCLARVRGRDVYGVLRGVCARWRALTMSDGFYHVRVRAGAARPHLLTLSRPESLDRGHFRGELYDPQSNTSRVFTTAWRDCRQKRDAPGGLAACACVAIGFEIFVIGGATPTHIFSPVTATWRTGAAMLTPRRDFACAAVRSKIYVAGGLSSVSGYRIASAEVYDPESDTWCYVADMPELRSGSQGVAVAGKMFIVGDQRTYAPNRSATPALLAYDPARDTWQRLAPLPLDLFFFQAAAVRGRLFVLGGTRSSSAAPCWGAPLAYDAAHDAWTPTVSPESATCRWQPGACTSRACSHLTQKGVNLSVASVAVGSYVLTVSRNSNVWAVTKPAVTPVARRKCQLDVEFRIPLAEEEEEGADRGSVQCRGGCCVSAEGGNASMGAGAGTGARARVRFSSHVKTRFPWEGARSSLVTVVEL